MIRIVLGVPPAHYAARVRDRGRAFLRRNPNPSHVDWNRHSYWREIHNDLYRDHNGICAYCAAWTPRRRLNPGDDNTSVDHFIPKSVDHNQAYEWTNFRLSRSRLNHRKDNHRDVLDPCTISNDWFVLDFSSFLVKPDYGLSRGTFTRVKATIDRLELNLDTDYVNERIAVIRDYTLDRLAIVQVETKYPFIAQQIRLQNFDVHFKPRLQRFFSTGRP